MRILQVGANCGFGGAETVIASLVRGLKKKDIQVDAFFYQDGGGKVQFQDICDVWFARDYPLAEVVLKGCYDLIHCIAEEAPRVERNLRQALYNGPVVITHHGWFGGSMGSEYVTSVSRFGANEIQDRCPKPVYVVYNGIDTDKFSPCKQETSGKPIMGWVGRAIDPSKDSAALTAIAASGIVDDYNIVAVDGSPIDAEIECWLPSSSKVIRQMPWRDMPDFYRSVGASGGFLLSTSRVERCPMNIIEAQACGCPVIAPAVGGIPEIVAHEVTGFVFERKQGLAGIKAALDWLKQDGQHEKAAIAGTKLMNDKFSEQKMCQEYIGLYERAVAAHHQGTINRMAQAVLGAGIAPVRMLRNAIKRPRA